jgi:hypothetical protein
MSALDEALRDAPVVLTDKVPTFGTLGRSFSRASAFVKLAFVVFCVIMVTFVYSYVAYLGGANFKCDIGDVVAGDTVIAYRNDNPVNVPCDAVCDAKDSSTCCAFSISFPTPTTFQSVQFNDCDDPIQTNLPTMCFCRKRG